MGDMPFMTPNGTFIINGTERVIVSQMHRSPGRVLRSRPRPHACLGQAAVRRPHHPLSRLLARLRVRRQGHRLRAHRPAPQAAGDDAALCAGHGRRGDPLGLLQDHHRQGDQARLEGAVRRREDARHDAVGRPRRRASRARWWPRPARRSPPSAPASSPRRASRRCCSTPTTSPAGTWPRTSSTWRPARSTARPARSSTAKLLEALKEAKVKEFPILDIDHVTIGAFIRNTLNVDKNSNHEEALMDVYRVMRPGEPPTLEAATRPVPRPVLRFGALRPLRRRPRQDEHAPRPQGRGHRAHAAQGGHPRGHQDAGRPARRQGRDRRHRSSRQPARALGRRADGEPVPPGPPAHGARHQGAHELGRYRHGDAAGPDQRQAGGGRRARVLRLLAALPVHGPDQPAVRDHAQAAALGAGPGRPHARARGLRGARRAPDALRPHLPDRDARRPQHRPHQLARHLRARQQVRLHREPLPQGRQGQGDRRGRLPLGHGGGALSRRPGQRRDRRQGQAHRRSHHLPLLRATCCSCRPTRSTTSTCRPSSSCRWPRR